ncbi:MAG: glyoxylate/hydroxypyruvate reductase A [Betaproteobacteria bacterium]|nr:MAG: glyoxylate/hydroxypyruvate reductase A [Betaproteobacteria bacterium]
MRLLLATATHAQAWRDAFAAALPGAELHVWPDAPPEVDYALVWKPPPECFARVRVRRAIANLGAGVDALLRVPTLPADVPVLRLTDAGMAEQMVEYVALAVLRAFREQREYARQQRDGRWMPRPRLDKTSYRVGILGMGVLGSAVAQGLLPLGFPLAGWSRRPRRVDGVATWSGADGLDRVLAGTCVLVCLLPSTPDTRGLLDRRTLARLPRGAHLVNVGRGDLVVEPDLLALLDEGHLASATLDVFDAEPLPAGHPFWHHPRIDVTPHVSAATLFHASAAQVAARIAAHARGGPLDGVVDRALGY